MTQRTPPCAVEQESHAAAHVIAEIAGTKDGPLLIAIAGLHGNEPAGVEAATRTADTIASLAGKIAGSVVLLAGNTRALARNTRFVDGDLNRRWTPAFIEHARSFVPTEPERSEDAELRELLAVFDRLVGNANGEVYVIDLHTTSAGGVPFATLGDTLRNRAFAANFPVPIILGIEEQLDGTMLEYLNNLGCVTLGFEAGQHVDASSIDNHESLIWLALVAAGNLSATDVPGYEMHRARLASVGGGRRFVEIRSRHAVRPGDGFLMEPGFTNFTPIRKSQPLAQDWRGPILAPEKGLLLMPLYQPLGDDGFFVAREIKQFWLKVSSVLRRLGIASWAALLPGVRKLAADGDSFIVNTYLARLFPLQLFHLLGFRKQRWADGFLVVTRRRFDRQGPRASTRDATPTDS